MRHQLTGFSEDRWVALGEFLIRRRIEMNLRYADRKLFAKARNLHYALVGDIENANRFNYSLPTIILVERAYRLPPGAVREFLASGETSNVEPVLAEAS